LADFAGGEEFFELVALVLGGCERGEVFLPWRGCPGFMSVLWEVGGVRRD
jgi:hypothetical protein